jgi:hypothetical protein
MTDASTATAAPNPGASTPPPAPPAGFISDADYDRLPPDQQSRYARSRGDGESGSKWIARTVFEKPDPAAKVEDATTAAVTEDGKLRIGEMLLSEQDIRTLMTEKAAADLRKASLPATAEAYEAKLPEGMKLPVEFSFNTGDPAFLAVRNWAHAQGFSQQQFSDLLGHYANSEAAKQVLISNAAKAEVEKLGAMGTARLTAIDQWLRGLIGDDHGKAVRSMIVTAKIAEGLERLATKFASQGAAPFSQAHREHPESPGRVSEEQWNAMSQAQKLDYARSHDQRQFQR